MEFEFDPKKSAGNLDKHGIDFIQAQALWADPDFVEIPARTTDEPRTLVIGRIEGKHWVFSAFRQVGCVRKTDILDTQFIGNFRGGIRIGKSGIGRYS